MRTVFDRIIFITILAIIFIFINGLFWIAFDYTFGTGYFKEKTKTQLVQPPNYDKESLLELMEQGECIGGTIEEGKFSVFVCKE